MVEWRCPVGEAASGARSEGGRAIGGRCGEQRCGATQRAEVGAGRSRRGPAGAATRGGLLDLIAGTAHDRGKAARSWRAVCAAGWSTGVACGGVVCPRGECSTWRARSGPTSGGQWSGVKPWAVCSGVAWPEGLAARAAGRSRARWAVGRGAEGWPVARWGGQAARPGRRVGGGRASGVEQPLHGKGRGVGRRCFSRGDYGSRRAARRAWPRDTRLRQIGPHVLASLRVLVNLPPHPWHVHSQ